MLELSQTHILTLFAAFLCVPLYVLHRRIFGTHPLDKLPGPASKSWLRGSFEDMYGTYNWEFQATMGSAYGATSSFRAPFGERMLYTFDPKAMHHIFVKDAMSYDLPNSFMHSVGLTFGPGVLSTPLGDKHRKQRKMLGPAFSIAHMKDLLPTFYQVIHKVENSIAKTVHDGPQEIDMLRWMGRTALELIGQSGLGVSFDELEDEENAHPFAKTMKELLPALARLAFETAYVLPYVAELGTPSLRRLASHWIPKQDFQSVKTLSDTLWKISIKIFEEKKRALSMGDEVLKQQIASGKDVLNILMRENMKASEEDRLDDEELLGQMAVLTFAATDTTSSALSRTLLLLATHPEAQHKLREELGRAFENGNISYDELVSLPYLDAICRETLRLYPPATKLDRTAKCDTVLPLSMPTTGRDGTVVTEVAIPKGTTLFISVLNANRNPEVWGEHAHEWKPERWLEPLPSSVLEAKIPGVYSHLMTFNGGQRACIGFKFSQLEMKVVLARLILKFEFSPSVKELVWENGFVASPVVSGSKGSHEGHLIPAMPLMVTQIRK